MGVGSPRALLMGPPSENEEKEELVITEHEDSYLEIVSTDYLPIIDVEYTKKPNKDRRPNDVVKLQDFISVKGITALGNQLTSEKVNTITLLDPEPYAEPTPKKVEEHDVVDEEEVKGDAKTESSTKSDDIGQGKLFDDED